MANPKRRKALERAGSDIVTVCGQVTTFKTVKALSRETRDQRAAEGTLAYVSERGGELYIRARNGWRKIQVCTADIPSTAVLSVRLALAGI